MFKYYAVHLYDETQIPPIWIGYMIKKETKNDFKGVGVIYHKHELKKVLKALNGEDK